MTSCAIICFRVGCENIYTTLCGIGCQNIYMIIRANTYTECIHDVTHYYVLE